MRFFSLLFLSAWCGLAAGLLEVATIVVRKRFFDPDQLLHMSRHFVWLAPLADIAIFLVLGLLGGAIAQAWPSRGRWLLTRVLGALVVLPSLLVAFPRIYDVPGWSWRWGWPRGWRRSSNKDATDCSGSSLPVSRAASPLWPSLPAST